MNSTSQPSSTLSVIHLQSPDGQLKATFHPHQGGRLVKLTYQDQLVIDELETMPYEESYAGAILFPFANRIQDGTYQFKAKNFQLACNEKGKNNAIHGLIYNQNFEVTKQEETPTQAVLELNYAEKNSPQGFPFQYQVQLYYALSNEGLTLQVEVKNTGSEAFPFTLGWHPYFYCDDVEKSFLSFTSHKVILMNDKNIALGVSEHPVENPYSLKNKQLDDCFVLNGREVEFFTPHYKFELQGYPKSNYLQLYTPLNEQRIAIEPMTGISDSFNHKKGLQVVKPGKSKKETWQIKFL